MSAARQASRSEVVRQRRRQHTQKREAQSSALATRPLAPITSRALPPVYAPPQRMAPASARRRYQAALSMPGIEVRLPTISFTSRSLKWRLVSLTVSLALGLGLYFVWTSPFFQVSAPRVSGNARIETDGINAVLGVEGQPIFTIVPAELATRLRLNYPEITAAQVVPYLPNVVVVDVVERKPVISWQQGDGYTWIDDSGVAFRPRGTAGNLIAVEALAAPPAGTASNQDPFSPVPFIASDMVQAIKTLAPSVPQGSTLVYDPRYGLGWSDSRGWQVFFGSEARSMALKLEVYQSLVNTLAGEGIIPSFISVQYANAPYYRMNQ